MPVLEKDFTEENCKPLQLKSDIWFKRTYMTGGDQFGTPNSSVVEY
jgi:hypothetical protein